MTEHRGRHRYVRGVLAQWQEDANCRLTLVTRSFLAWRRRGEFARFAGGASFHLRRGVPADVDVVWHPWSGSYIPTPLRSVLTVHDLQGFLSNTRDQAPAASSSRHNDAESAALLRGLDEAFKVIVPSRYLAEQLHSVLGTARERIVVIPLAADPVFTAQTDHNGPRDPHEYYVDRALQGRRYILHVGNPLDPVQNFATLYDAWRRAFPDQDVALVTTASPGSTSYEGVVSLLHPEDETLARLYRGALAVAIPAVQTHFGLTLLEAMSCGAPTIASAVGALPEVGGPAPYWVNAPTDVMAWAIGLQRLALEPTLRGELQALGRTQTAQYSWRRTAQATLAVLADVAQRQVFEGRS